MSTSDDNPGAVGGHALASVREHWVRAATYDATCSRYGDGLVKRDEIAKNTTTALSAVTTLGVFGSLFAHNPSLSARLIVFLISATITAVAAIRKQGEWVSTAIRLKERGVEWNRQRNLAGDLAQMILDGRSVGEDMRQKLSDNESKLLEHHPRVPNRVYDQMKERKKKEFDEIYG
jgi:hypothetical protein